jgi:Na+/H+ antiporter NhaD/arsenite permease-like protein
MSDGHGSTEHHGFSGPKCWVLSAIVGALVGLLAALVVPQSFQGAGGQGDAPRVVQVNPDGSRVERLLDGTTAPEGASTSKQAETGKSGAGASAGHGLDVPLWLCVPFAVLLLSIALMPFVSAKFWHAHYPDFAFFLGAAVLTYVCVALGGAGRGEMLHAGLEYYSFIALVGGLYLVSGGIVIDIRDQGNAFRNTGLLAFGAVLANLLGTTGASVLLIKPFLRMNKGRLRPLHAVFFIFMVSNCGGCLTPIGDPPLYLGYLKGVPFFWTLEQMWPMWLTVNGVLLAMYFVYDLRVPAGPKAGAYEARAMVHDPSDRTPLIVGWRSVVCLLLLVAGVFIDPLLKKFAGISGIPIGATFQIIVAITAYMITPASVRHSNQFSFEPLKEVGFLFVGIFLTMAPALAFLRGHAASLGLETPTQYYFLTGSLSAVLDNAPTYLSFLQVAMGTLHVPLTESGIREFIAASYELTHQSGGAAGEVVKFQGLVLLEAISLGAVFFGAMTYIGNGPNFMVKSIVDAAYQQGQAADAAPGQRQMGAKMPSFLGYVVYSVIVLMPVLVLNWWLFIR